MAPPPSGRAACPDLLNPQLLRMSPSLGVLRGNLGQRGPEMGFSANPLSQANAVVSPPPGSATAASPPPATSCFPVTLGSGLYHTRVSSCCTRGWTLGASAPSATDLVREPAGQALTQTLRPPILAESKSTPFRTQMNHVLRPDKPRNKSPPTHFTERANQPAQQEHRAQVGSHTRWWAPA